MKKEGITDEDLAGIGEEEFLKEMFNIEDMDIETLAAFPLYKGKICNKNDGLFMRRNNVLQYLAKKWIIKISPINFIAELNKIDTEADEDFKNLLLKWKESLVNKHWEDIIERQIASFKWKEKYLPTILFKVQEIKELLASLEESDIEEFTYRDKVLRYWGKCIYAPGKDSDRDVFLDMIFSRDKWEYFSLNSIYQELEWWEINYLSEQQSKKIYNIKDKINKKIKEHTWVVKFFSLWVWDNKGKIYRKY